MRAGESARIAKVEEWDSGIHMQSTVCACASHTLRIGAVQSGRVGECESVLVGECESVRARERTNALCSMYVCMRVCVYECTFA